MIINIFFSFVGGMLPRLASLASSLTENNPQPYPALGFYIGLLIYAFLGGVIGYACKKSDDNLRDYLFRGIAAPAIIASFLSGQAQHNIVPPEKIKTSMELNHSFFFNLAHAAAKESENSSIDKNETRALIITMSNSPYGIVPEAGNIKIYTCDNQGDMKLSAITNFGYHQLEVKIPKKKTKLMIQYSYGENSYTKYLEVENRGDLSDLFVSLNIISNSKDSFWTDFKWALGWPRIANIESVSMSISYDL